MDVTIHKAHMQRYVSEIAHPSYRAGLTGLYGAFWFVGALMAALVTFGTQYIESTWSWRIPSLVRRTTCFSILIAQLTINSFSSSLPCFVCCSYHFFQRVQGGWSLRVAMMKLKPCSSNTMAMEIQIRSSSLLNMRRFVRP